MASNLIGLNVVEVDGRASPTIPAAATSVAGFIGPAERGVPVRGLASGHEAMVTHPRALADVLLELAG